MEEIIIKTTSDLINEVKRILYTQFGQCSKCFDYFYPPDKTAARPECLECKTRRTAE